MKNTTSPCSSGPGRSASTTSATSLGQLALAGDAEHVAGRVRRDDPLAEQVVGLGVAAGGQRDGHHGARREQRGSRERGPDQATGGESLRGCRCRSARAAAPAPPSAVARIASRSWSVSGPATGTVSVRRVVRLGDLGGGQVQPAEGAELVVRQRRHRPGDPGAVARVVRRAHLDPGQRETLGVDQLQGARVLRRGGDIGRARSG